MLSCEARLRVSGDITTRLFNCIEDVLNAVNNIAVFLFDSDGGYVINWFEVDRLGVVLPALL